MVTGRLGKEWLVCGIKEPPNGHGASGAGGVIDGCCEWCPFEGSFEEGEGEC